MLLCFDVFLLVSTLPVISAAMSSDGSEKPPPDFLNAMDLESRFSSDFPHYQGRFKDVTDDHIKSWLMAHEAVWEKIKEGKIYSKRHNIYVNGGIKARDGLKWTYCLGRVLSLEQQNTFRWWLVEKFCCRTGMKLFSYVMDVLVFEAVVYYIMEVLHTDYKQAEKIAMLIGDQVRDDEFTKKEEGSDPGLPGLDSAHTPLSSEPVPNDLREFTEADLGKMTEDFSNVIGWGSFGCVYKGIYEHTPVAVKVINPKVLQDIGNKTFKTELYSLTKFRHPNLINLMGFCQVRAALVYPFMENMSLFHALHEYKVVKPITWDDRHKILNKTACAVLYLHSSIPPCVHRDIKSHNILLDGALNPYLADFGFLMPLPMESPNNCLFTAAGSIAIAGTRGYLAPEFMAGKIGPKLDVYSYGIVCLETFTGLLAYSEERENDQLIDHCSSEGLQNLSMLADQKAGKPPQVMVDVFFRVIKVATEKNYKRRSSMEEIIEKWKSI